MSRKKTKKKPHKALTKKADKVQEAQQILAEAAIERREKALEEIEKVFRKYGVCMFPSFGLGQGAMRNSAVGDISLVFQMKIGDYDWAAHDQAIAQAQTQGGVEPAGD